MSVSKMSKDDRKKRNHTQNQILTSVGCLFVAAVGIFSASGAKFATNAINRDAMDTIVLAQQYKPSQNVTSEPVKNATNNVVSNKTTNVEKTDTKSEAESNSDTEWSDEQVKWMQENHITYNENGQPVDENGNIVTDPTVTVDSDSSKSLESTSVEPETNTSWADGMDWLTQLDNGDYAYTVKSGDCLDKICNRAGFTLNEVVDYNNIDNPNVIHVGQQIVFPKAGPNTTSNLGLG